MLYATSPPPRGTQRPPPPPLPPSLVAMRTEGEKPSLSRSDFFHAPGEASTTRALSFLSSHICCAQQLLSANLPTSGKHTRRNWSERGNRFFFALSNSKPVHILGAVCLARDRPSAALLAPVPPPFPSSPLMHANDGDNRDTSAMMAINPGRPGEEEENSGMGNFPRPFPLPHSALFSRQPRRRPTLSSFGLWR